MRISTDLAAQGLPCPSLAVPNQMPYLAAGATVFCAAYNGTLVAVFALADALRPEAPALLAALAKRGVTVEILSGDHAAAVARVAGALGVPPARAHAGCTPAAKAAVGEHDENVSYETVAARVGEDLAARLREVTLAVYTRAADGDWRRGRLQP